MSVEAGQVYVECGTPEDRELRRIKVHAVVVTPQRHGTESVLALVSTLVWTTTGEREMRLRSIHTGSLYEDAMTRLGRARLSGYVLEDSFTSMAALKGWGPVLHAVRPIAVKFDEDWYTSACALRGKWSQAPAKALWCGICMDVMAELNKIKRDG